MSVIRMKKKQPEVLQISENADLPSWLKPKKMYTELDTLLEYDVKPLASKEMQWLLSAYQAFRTMYFNQMEENDDKVSRRDLEVFTRATELYETIFVELEPKSEDDEMVTVVKKRKS